MVARTSDRGEPAKINFCRLRTDSVENSPDLSFAGAPSDESPAADCTALFMNCPSCGIRFRNSIFGSNEARTWAELVRCLKAPLPPPREVIKTIEESKV